MKTATSYEFVKDWFQRSQKSAASQGKSDSAALWRDGLEHLEHLKAKNDKLLKALAHSKEVIRTWHDMDTKGQDHLWLIYQQSPEMKKINKVLEEK